MFGASQNLRSLFCNDLLIRIKYSLVYGTIVTSRFYLELAYNCLLVMQICELIFLVSFIHRVRWRAGEAATMLPTERPVLHSDDASAPTLWHRAAGVGLCSPVAGCFLICSRGSGPPAVLDGHPPPRPGCLGRFLAAAEISWSV